MRPAGCAAAGAGQHRKSSCPAGPPRTDDDDLRLQPAFPCIDSCDNFFVPADKGDLDEDGDSELPASIKSLVERKIEQPDADDREEEVRRGVP